MTAGLRTRHDPSNTHVDNWRYIRQHKQAQIETIRKKLTRIDQDYRVGYQVLVRNKSESNDPSSMGKIGLGRNSVKRTRVYEHFFF